MWEYHCEAIGDDGRDVRLAELGREGWELVTIDSGVWIFKRSFAR
jgi:hypothetical protein